MINEKRVTSWSGYRVIALLLLAVLICIGGMIMLPIVFRMLLGVITLLCVILCLVGFYIVAPNEGRVAQLFGEYAGTDKQQGLRWANPFYTKVRVSLRVRNFESGQLKVNDLTGNPIEIAAVVVWKVTDTAEAIFEVDDYEGYVAIQTEAAIRNMATSFPYDDHTEGQVSLRGDNNTIADILKQEVQDRLGKAGVEVLESRISHLAYAPEIASAMLQRQQASAIVAARHQIVDGAVLMVEDALNKLSAREVVELDNERKAAMVSNLLVVLCGDRAAQPVINSGSLYT